MTNQAGNASSVLAISGPGGFASMDLTLADLEAMPNRHQVPDVGLLLPGRHGTALRFRGLVEHLAPATTARFVHVVSGDGSFSASLDLDRLTSKGLVLYALDGEALPVDAGGPYRLFVQDSDDCSINVKAVARLTFAAEPGVHTAGCSEEPSAG